MIEVPAFVVPGGGDDGVSAVTRLLRAVEARRLRTDRIVVVDRDPGCAAAGLDDPRVRFERAAWADWLDGGLDDLEPGSHFVPYHWAPHLLVDWLARHARRAGAAVERGGEVPTPGVPVERPTRDGDVALSYATWLCPPTCIEPALCPHTRGPKDWSLAGDLDGPAGGDDRIVFRCLHLVWGVATVPLAAILAARGRVVGGLAGPRTWLVATSSHCHALATALHVRPGPPLV